MKTAIFFASLLVLVTSPGFASAWATTEYKVFDIDGHELQRDTNYYILPVVRGNGGGLKFYSGMTGQCPMDVFQEPNELNSGCPVTFSPQNPQQPIVQACSDLNIKFSAPSKCAQSTVWRLDSRGFASGQHFVSTGGVLGSPSGATINNWFRIEKSSSRNNSYKLVYCPKVCNTCRPVCGDLGIAIDRSGARRLALNTGRPFEVYFKRA